MARPLRRPKEITYPERPWQGIARVTVRRKDYRFDGQYGSPESVEQHAEWVRIYDQTGIPPEIETVRASLHLQRERISLPTDYEPREERKTTDRFPVAMMATAITCTLVLSMSLVGSSLLQTQPTPTLVPTAQTAAQQAPMQIAPAQQASTQMVSAQPAPMQPASAESAPAQPPVVDGVELNEIELARIRSARRLNAPGEVYVSSSNEVLRELVDNAATSSKIQERAKKLSSLPPGRAAELRQVIGRTSHEDADRVIDEFNP